jgi:hypothetical protein
LDALQYHAVHFSSTPEDLVRAACMFRVVSKALRLADIPTGQGYRAITNSEVHGFHLGGDAFKSSSELTKTILHELHRLNFSEVVKEGEIHRESASVTLMGLIRK